VSCHLEAFQPEHELSNMACSSQLESLLVMLPSMMEAQPDGNRVAAGAGVKGALAGLVSQHNIIIAVSNLSV